MPSHSGLAGGPFLAPDWTRFVGREAEIATVSHLLVKTRSVTLTGPLGSGKTRLAGEVLRRGGTDMAPVAWVELVRGMPWGGEFRAPASLRSHRATRDPRSAGTTEPFPRASNASAPG